MKTIFAPIALATLIAGASTSAFAITSADLYGSPAAANSSQRVIVIDGNTRSVDVKRGESVTIRAGDKTVGWRFDGYNTSFPLSKIVPDSASVSGKPVKVYVQQAQNY
jgi:hypothetical protein